MTYTNSIKNTLKIKIPQQTHTIHSILLKIKQLHNHLLNLNLSYHFINFNTNFIQFFHIQKKSITITKLLIKSHKTYNLNLINNIHHNILKKQHLQTLKLIHKIHTNISKLIKILLTTPNIKQHTQNINILNQQITHNLHFNHPYTNYNNIPKTLFTFTNNNIFSHIIIHIKKTFNSLTILKFTLNNIPNTPLLTKNFNYKPHTFTLNFIKTPHNKNIH